VLDGLRSSDAISGSASQNRLSSAVCFDEAPRVTLPGWLEAVVLFLRLPIPLYWFVVDPFLKSWKGHPRTVYAVALVCSWLPVAVAVIV
jgi:hypothetical protein